MKTFNYKKRNFFTLSPHLLGLIFIAIGLVILISPSFIVSDNSFTKIVLVGGANILFGTIVVFSYGGVFINFEEKYYQEYYNLCGYKFGTVKKLPVISLIKSVVKEHTVTTVPNGVNPTMTGNITVYYVLLYAASSKPFLVFEYSNKEKSINVATELAGYCGAQLELTA